MTLLDSMSPADASADDIDAAPPVASQPQPSSRPQPPAKSFTSDALASLGLAVFSLAVAAGFARVFAGWTFFDNLVVLVVVGHGIGLAARRLGVPTWITIPTVAVALFWTVGIMFYGATYSWGAPSGDTWTLFNAELDLVREQFQVAVAPVVDDGGWPVLAAIGMAFAVCLSDAFAFGALARAEALVPGGVLFVFIAALGADRLRVDLTVALVAAGVVATVLLRAHHAPGGIRASGRVVGQAVCTALVVALLAGYVGQRLPGARAEALFDTRGTGDGSGAELSALVDIRSRLTNQRETELIVVTANAESYWRSTTLPSFDGTTWEPADREVGTADFELIASRSAPSIRQQVRITGLAGTMIPVAPDPTAATATTSQDTIDYDQATTTLSSRDEFESGDSFVVESAPPRFDPSVLASATSIDPGDPIYLELPDDFPEIATRTAADVTAGTTTTYDTAIALQNWFKSEFTYSLQVQPGHGNTAIEGFLRDRVGYCEQFAGTYAAMMRSLGIPARVAVGFTTGKAIGAGQYSVAGRNAHAWPEVWFDGLGWVLFEPTPGRGAPGTESYTGVPAAQDTTSTSDAPEETADEEAAIPTPTVAPDPLDPAGPAVGDPPELPSADAGGTDASTAPDDGTAGTAPWLLALLAVALIAPAAVRRIRRRAVGRTNDEKLRRLWDRALRSLRDVDVPIATSDTPTEIAFRAAAVFPIASRPIKSLAETLTEATYRPEGSDGFDVAGAYGSSRLRDGAHWTHQIERAVTESLGTAARVRRYFTRWQ